MGKLHSLRRAIKRCPHKWYNTRSTYRDSKGQWVPRTWYGFDKHSYHRFIVKVLSSL